MENKHAEKMSGLIDGELDAQELAVLLQEVGIDGLATDWDLYLHIGSGLRGEESVAMSADFAASMAAKLEKEPSHSSAPQVLLDQVKHLVPNQPAQMQWWHKKRVALVAAGSAALAAMGLLGGQQLMLALNEPASKQNTNEVRLATAPSPKPVTLLANTVANSGGVSVAASAASVEIRQRLIADGKAQDVVMLRDPEIDQYFLAHQRLSPALYSTAQYARSATFATEKDK